MANTDGPASQPVATPRWTRVSTPAELVAAARDRVAAIQINGELGGCR